MADSEEDGAAALVRTIEIRAAGLARSGRLHEATELLREVVARMPAEPRPRLLLARILGQRGAYNEARLALQGVEGGDGERLRRRLQALAASGSRPARPWRVLAVGAVSLSTAALVVVGLYAGLLALGGRSDSDRPAPAVTGSGSPVSAPASAQRPSVPTLALLDGWGRLAQALEALPPAHRVRLRPEIRSGGPVAVLEGTVVSEVIAKRIRREVDTAGVEADLGALEVSGNFSVHAGDTLSRIAAQVYGDGSRWPVIWDANREMVEDPDEIRQGMLLAVP